MTRFGVMKHLACSRTPGWSPPERWAGRSCTTSTRSRSGRSPIGGSASSRRGRRPRSLHCERPCRTTQRRMHRGRGQPWKRTAPTVRRSPSTCSSVFIRRRPSGCGRRSPPRTSRCGTTSRARWSPTGSRLAVHVRDQGRAGDRRRTVLESEPPRRLVCHVRRQVGRRCHARPAVADHVGDRGGRRRACPSSRSCTRASEPEVGDVEQFGGGMPFILSGLKTLLETGEPLVPASQAANADRTRVGRERRTGTAGPGRPRPALRACEDRPWTVPGSPRSSSRGPLLTDGGMGTSLVARGVAPDACFELLNADAPGGGRGGASRLRRGRRPAGRHEHVRGQPVRAGALRPGGPRRRPEPSRRRHRAAPRARRRRFDGPAAGPARAVRPGPTGGGVRRLRRAGLGARRGRRGPVRHRDPDRPGGGRTGGRGRAEGRAGPAARGHDDVHPRRPDAHGRDARGGRRAARRAGRRRARRELRRRAPRRRCASSARCARAAAGVPLVARPNAGGPLQMGGRFLYPATPDYFAESAAGAARRRRRGRSAGAAGPARSTRERWPRSSRGRVTARSRSASRCRTRRRARRRRAGARRRTWRTKLAEGRFVVAVEMEPPRGFSVAGDDRRRGDAGGGRRRRDRRGRQPDGADAHEPVGGVPADPGARRASRRCCTSRRAGATCSGSRATCSRSMRSASATCSSAWATPWRSATTRRAPTTST